MRLALYRLINPTELEETGNRALLRLLAVLYSPTDMILFVSCTDLMEYDDPISRRGG